MTPIEFLERKIELKKQYLFLLTEEINIAKKQVLNLMDEKIALLEQEPTGNGKAA